MNQIPQSALKQWWGWLLLAAVLCGLAVGGYYFSKSRNKLVSSSSTGTSSALSALTNLAPASNWVERQFPSTSPKLQFSVDKSWLITSAPTEATLTSFYSGQSSQSVQFEIRVFSNLNSAAYLRLEISPKSTQTATPTPIYTSLPDHKTETSQLTASGTTYTKVTDSGPQNNIPNRKAYSIQTKGAAATNYQFFLSLEASYNDGDLNASQLATLQSTFDQFLTKLVFNQ